MISVPSRVPKLEALRCLWTLGQAMGRLTAAPSGRLFRTVRSHHLRHGGAPDPRPGPWISGDFGCGRGDFGLSDAEMSYAASCVGLAAVLACGVSCLSDRFGRAKVLTWTLAPYTLATAFTALAPGVASFAPGL